MEFSGQMVFDVVNEIWDKVLSLPLERAVGLEAVPSGRTLSTTIQIAGPPCLAVVLLCPAALSSKAAGCMLGMGEDEVSKEEVLDAMGELGNMVGGGLKSLMPHDSHLGLPTVVEGTEVAVRLPGTRLVSLHGFRSENLPFQVMLFERAC